MEESLQQYLKQQFDTDLDTCSDWQLYSALQNLVLETIQQKKKEPNQEQGGRRLYYVSAEFLIGRLLGNNLLNLGPYGEAQQLLARHGHSLPDLEELEPEPSLGNGGLGRLAACFLDSIATLGLNGEGLGLAYHFGLFRQKFEQNSQHEYPDRWHNEPDWLRRTEETFTVPLGRRRSPRGSMSWMSPAMRPKRRPGCACSIWRPATKVWCTTASTLTRPTCTAT